MGQIDTIGAYKLEVVEAGITVTKENKYPQLVLRVRALAKYIDDAAGIKHFGLTAPGWVDWQSYNEDSLAYLVLFKSADTFNSDTALLNYEQAQKAFGWDGAEFETIAKLGQQFLGRFEVNTYKDKESTQLSWIDHINADPVRSLKTLDTDAVSALSKLLKAGIGKTAAKPAGAKPATATKPKPGSNVAPKPAAAPQDTATATLPSVNTATTASPSKGPPKLVATAPVTEEPLDNGLPRAVSQNDAWEYLMGKKGANTDAIIEETWLAACGEVGDGRQEAQFTTGDWARIRDLVIRDLAL